MKLFQKKLQREGETRILYRIMEKSLNLYEAFRKNRIVLLASKSIIRSMAVWLVGLLLLYFIILSFK